MRIAMKLYTCTTFTGFWPVGTAAVVWAANAKSAAERLNIALRMHGLEGDATAEDMIEFPRTGKIQVRILCDGDY